MWNQNRNRRLEALGEIGLNQQKEELSNSPVMASDYIGCFLSLEMSRLVGQLSYILP